MPVDGPPLDRLTHRLAECPADFLEAPRLREKGSVWTVAVVHDLLVALGWFPNPETLAAFQAPQKQDLPRLKLTQIACWLLYDEGFRQPAVFGIPAAAWLRSDDFRELSETVNPELFVSDPERREELVRLALAALNLLPAGEHAAQAEDRLKAINSMERSRILRDMQEKQKRARELREAMKKKEAEEAAARANREW